MLDVYRADGHLLVNQISNVTITTITTIMVITITIITIGMQHYMI